jgi:hypothetical protein
MAPPRIWRVVWHTSKASNQRLGYNGRMKRDEQTPNPYESPNNPMQPQFTDSSSNNLELRVAELERKIAQSWFLRSNLFARVFAVWACFLIGYLILAAIIGPIVLLIELLFHL